MDIQSIFSIGLLGAAFGGLLAYASQQFAVEVDPRVEAISAVLPGANCGACSFPGCNALAEAIVSGSVPVNACPVGGAAVAAKVASIMGVTSNSDERRLVAHVYCARGCNRRALYEGIPSCRAAAEIAGGSDSCIWSCLGLGDCVRACPFGALVIDDKGKAVVDEDKCQSCGLCAKTCPRRVIGMVPDHWSIHVNCSSQERGVAVRNTGCAVGCLACGLCERTCPFQAIHVINEQSDRALVEKTRAVKSLAVIDYSLCRECRLCAAKCPTHAIKVDIAKAFDIVEIDSTACDGCTACVAACPVHAIQGEAGQTHTTDTSLCVGCGLCLNVCPTKAIHRMAVTAN
ncbi:MAG: RnfABCDGE type electron transport complex subunit B [Symbiobacteriaceae bacterium]|nr:RnfABCDGE type electron transport complex subunit B [Symbiobacteriaceae bacterium]